MSKVYTKEDTLIKAKIGEVFTIELESNPTTGYQWQESFDADKIELLDKKIENASQLVGGGKEIFTFRTVGDGESKIELDYKREWETGAADSATIILQAKK